jgi:hypothetical protein
MIIDGNKLELTSDEKINQILIDVAVIKSRVHHFPCQEHSKEIKDILAFKNRLAGYFIGTNLLTGLITFLFTKVFR